MLRVVLTAAARPRRMSTWTSWFTRTPSIETVASPPPPSPPQLTRGNQLTSDLVFRKHKYLEGLRLGTAKNAATLTREEAYLLFWCKRQLGVFATLADETAALAALPRTHLAPTPLELLVSTTCTLSFSSDQDADKIRALVHRVATLDDPFATSPDHPIAPAWRALVARLSNETAAATKIHGSRDDGAVGASKKTPPSSALEDWNTRVRAWRELDPHNRARLSPSPVMDTMMQLVGREHIKREFLNLYDHLMAHNQTVKPLHVCIVGNRGTGTSLVAHYYTRLLGSLVSCNISESYGQKLVDQGVENGYRKLVKNGGVVLIEQAGVLNEGAAAGRSTLRAMAYDMDKTPTMTFVMTGQAKEMTQLLGDHTALADRIATQWTLPDYTDVELLELFVRFLNARCRNTFPKHIDGGTTGHAARIVGRRLAAQPNNAHGVTKYVDVVLHRQAVRLLAASSTSPRPHFQILTFDDMVGPNPLTALETSAA
jgi:hypothetical protein